MELGRRAHSLGRYNVAFLAFLLTGAVEQCLQLLVEQGRVPEAAFMARTYMPSRIPGLLEAWRADLKQVNEKAAEALADPVRYPNLFPDLMYAPPSHRPLAAAANTLYCDLMLACLLPRKPWTNVGRLRLRCTVAGTGPCASRACL